MTAVGEYQLMVMVVVLLVTLAPAGMIVVRGRDDDGDGGCSDESGDSSGNDGIGDKTELGEEQLRLTTPRWGR